VPGKGGEVVTR